MFRYLIDKDVFESYYRTSLCRRLLNSKYESDSLCHIRHYGSPRPSSANVEEAEKLVVSKLRAEVSQASIEALDDVLGLVWAAVHL